VNTSNPFQIPSCLQRAELQQRHHERIQKGVMLAMAITATFLVGMLIQGYMSEHAKISSVDTATVGELAGATPNGTTVPEPKPVSILSSNPVVLPPAAPPVPKKKRAAGHQPF